MNRPATDPQNPDENIQDAAGVSLWRQVSEGLAADIRSGRYGIDDRLPPSTELARRFQVNRHTVLKAIAHLQAEGLLRMERGRGSYAVVNPVPFGLGSQQWFELNLREHNRIPTRTIISMEEKPASTEVARGLEMAPEAPVLLVTILGEADGVPVTSSMQRPLTAAAARSSSSTCDPVDERPYGSIINKAAAAAHRS
jgi:GntR family transcriptional regulator, phosphonate transport system regulatory protein